MGVFAWLRRRAQATTEDPQASLDADGAWAEAGPQTRFGMRPGATLSGLDFYQAIEFQRRWKLRLAAYVRGEARARQSWRDIARDDRCELGRWLHQAPALPQRQGELLAQLREQHARLHHAAAEVVRLADAGQREAALHALRQGDFAHASHATVARLSELFTQLNEPPENVPTRH